MNDYQGACSFQEDSMPLSPWAAKKDQQHIFIKNPISGYTWWIKPMSLCFIVFKILVESESHEPQGLKAWERRIATTFWQLVSWKKRGYLPQRLEKPVSVGAGSRQEARPWEEPSQYFRCLWKWGYRWVKNRKMISNMNKWHIESLLSLCVQPGTRFN